MMEDDEQDEQWIHRSFGCAVHGTSPELLRLQPEWCYRWSEV